MIKIMIKNMIKIIVVIIKKLGDLISVQVRNLLMVLVLIIKNYRIIAYVDRLINHMNKTLYIVIHRLWIFWLVI